MTIITLDDIAAAEQKPGATTPTPQVEPVDKPGINETIDAAMIGFNPTVQKLTKEAGPAAGIPFGTSFVNQFKDIEVDSEYDPWEYLVKIGREDLAKVAAFANSDEDIDNIIRHQNLVTEYQQTALQHGPAGRAAAFGAAIVDPTMLIPGTIQLRAFTTAGRALKGGVTSAGLFGAAIAGQEELRLQSDPTLTQKEAVTNAAIGTLIGGIFGAGASALSKTSAESLRAELGQIIRQGGLEVPADSVGAAKVLGGFELDPIVSKSLPITTGPEFLRGMTVRGLDSPSSKLREMTGNLFETNIKLKNNPVLGPVVEREINNARNQFIKTSNDVENLYFKYIGLPEDANAKTIRSWMGSRQPGKLKFNQFNEEVAKAMRRGNNHEIPEVATAARQLSKLQDEKFQQLKDLGIVPKDVEAKYAESYFQRVYDRDKILKDQATNQEFRSTLIKHFQRKNPDADPDVLAQQADETINNILGIGDQSIELDGMLNNVANLDSKVSKSQFLKQRVLDIEDEVLEPWLVNDALGIVNRNYIASSSMVAFQSKLNSLGYEHISDLKKAMVEEYDVLKRSFPERTAQLDKQLRRDVKLLNTMTSALLGRNNSPTWLRSLLKYNVMTMLGGVAISSLPDSAMVTLRHGYPRTIKNAFNGLTTGFKDIPKASANLKSIGVGMELESNRILQRLIEPDDVIGRMKTKGEATGDYMVNLFGRATGMSYWNTGWKRVAGHFSETRTLDALEALNKGKKLNNKEMARLKDLGIDVETDMGKRILDQFNKWKDPNSNLKVSNFDRWTDMEAKEAFANSIRKEVDFTILTPSQGDLPEWAFTDVGRVMFQFKSFSMAATNRILLAGLSKRDTETLLGMTTLIALGASTQLVKDNIAGRDVDYTFDELVSHGISRSGTLGLMFDYVSGLTPLGNNSRYAGMSAPGIVFGPTISTTQNLGSTVHAGTGALFGDTELSEAEKNAMIKLIPYQNLFYLRLLLDKLGDD